MTEEVLDNEVVDPQAGVTDSAPVNEGLQPADDAPIVEGAETDADPASDDAGAPRKKGVERRIGQLTRKYRQSEREKQELAARLEALEQRLGPAPELQRPTPDDFETTEDYEDALLDWHDQRRTSKSGDSSKAGSTATPDTAGQEVLVKLEEELADLEYPDAVLAVFDDEWPCSEAMTDFIVQSESRAELAYYLATHVAESEKLAAMSPVSAARELVKIEADLAKPKPSAELGASPPPPPSNPVRPGSRAVTDPDKMTPAQWRAWREDSLAKRA